MLKDLDIEELDLLSHADISYRILKEAKKTLNTPAIFKEVCRLLEYNDAQYMDKIGDFYTSLNLDKRFVLLDSSEWDLSERHSVKIELDDDEDEDDLDDDDYEEEVENEEEDEEEHEKKLDDDEDDLPEEEIEGLEDLTIVDEDEIE